MSCANDLTPHKELTKRLRVLLKNKDWELYQIQAGQNLVDWTKKHVSLSDITLILISPDLLDSEPDYSLAEHAVSIAPDKAVLVLLRACCWDITPLEKARVVLPLDRATLPQTGQDEWYQKVVTAIGLLMQNAESSAKIASLEQQNSILKQQVERLQAETSQSPPKNKKRDENHN